MGNRRTKKQKEKARQRFTISWSSNSDVNRHFEKLASPDKDPISKKESADILAKEDGYQALGKNVAKSLLLALGIILIELVIYLAGTSSGLF